MLARCKMESTISSSLIQRLSIIIATRNRVQSLKALLDSLQLAELPDGIGVEVLTVNNGSSDQTGALLIQEAARQRPFALKVMEEPLPGKARALNLGLANAGGDLLIILDDDVAVDGRCLIEHVGAYRQASFAAVQGKVLPGRDPEGRAADADKLREYNIPYIDYGDDFREIRGLTGTNMSFKRGVFEKIGFFDTRLGPGASGFSEDTEFSMRMRKAGFKIGYTPHAIVYHELNPNRYGREYNRMVEYRKGLSRSIYRQDSIPLRVIPDLVANCMRYGLYRLVGKTQKAYKTEGRIMKCWGYLMGKVQQRPKSNSTV
jgi:GT2 family glycosyltransferase